MIRVAYFKLSVVVCIPGEAMTEWMTMAGDGQLEEAVRALENNFAVDARRTKGLFDLMHHARKSFRKREVEVVTIGDNAWLWWQKQLSHRLSQAARRRLVFWVVGDYNCGKCADFQRYECRRKIPS